FGVSVLPTTRRARTCASNGRPSHSSSRADSCRFGMVNSGAIREGGVEQRLEEVLGLAKCFALHRTQTLESIHQSRKVLLNGVWRNDHRLILQLGYVDGLLCGRAG